MAFSTVFLTSSLCVPVQTPNRPFCVSQTTLSLMLPPQATRKFQYQPQKSNKRVFGTVKALQKDEERKIYTKNVEVFSNKHLLDSLANDIIQLSQQYIHQKGSFLVALSDTPSVRFLSKLVSPENVKTIDWSKWQFFWVEEEVVVPGYQLKRRLLPNELLHKLVYDEFLNPVKRSTGGNLNVVTIDYDLSVKQVAADRYENMLQEMVARNEIEKSIRGLPKFDLMLLGMGGDGRVGSLLPDHRVLDEEERWVTHVKSEDEALARLTLTLPVINSSSNIAMVVSGSAQANAVYYSLEDESSDRAWPAKRILPVEGGVMKWYLDKDAASRIFKEEIHIEKRPYKL